MGDSYNAYNGGAGPSSSISNGASTTERPSLPTGYGLRTKGLKPKDLVGIPWRLAFALQADGWYLRSDIIWAKPNPMPESVTDRPTKSHEYLFLLSKQERYYFDADAVREEAEYGRCEWTGKKRSDGGSSAYRSLADANRPAERGGFTVSTNVSDPSSGRNIRSVWNIPTESYPGSHFATYPRRLVEPCIKAGTSEKGCCPVCGAGWAREVERGELIFGDGHTRPCPTTRGDAKRHPNNRADLQPTPGAYRLAKTTGWRPGCTCHNDSDPSLYGPATPFDPVPAIILDPFSGSGTTGVVANALGRSYIGLELNREYIGLSQKRIGRPHAPIQRAGRTEHHPLFGDTA